MCLSLGYSVPFTFLYFSLGCILTANSVIMIRNDSLKTFFVIFSQDVNTQISHTLKEQIKFKAKDENITGCVGYKRMNTGLCDVITLDAKS